jgi:hypothetical protein
MVLGLTTKGKNMELRLTFQRGVGHDAGRSSQWKSGIIYELLQQDSGEDGS